MADSVVQLINKSLASISSCVKSIKGYLVTSDGTTLIEELEKNTEAILDLDTTTEVNIDTETTEDLLKKSLSSQNEIKIALEIIILHLRNMDGESFTEKDIRSKRG